jgi:hypothetical protein
MKAKSAPQQFAEESRPVPFNEALKRVWAAKPMHKTKLKPAKSEKKKPA